jgi:hypothetical protein
MTRHVELVRAGVRSSGRPILRGVERSSATLVKEQRKVREREEDNEVLRAPKRSIILIYEGRRVKGTEKSWLSRTDGCCNSVVLQIGHADQCSYSRWRIIRIMTNGACFCQGPWTVAEVLHRKLSRCWSAVECQTCQTSERLNVTK